MNAYDAEIEHKSKYVSGKACYVERNQAMIDDSDFCIFYYDASYNPPMRKHSLRSFSTYQPKSGTALVYSYAKKKKKTIINFFENF